MSSCASDLGFPKSVHLCFMKKQVAAILMSIWCIAAHAQLQGSLTHDNVERTYSYYVPTTGGGQSLPLVLVLHGTTQSGDDMIDVTGFNTLAEQNHFIAVYPNGIGNVWNVGIDLVGSTTDDLGFLDALVQRFIEDFGVDAQRVYSCGFSAGGYMSHKLACESTHCFAAIASVAGTMVESLVSSCSPTFETSVLQIHGTADFVVPYGGSAQAGVAVDDLMAFWSGVLGCASSPQMTNLPNVNLFDLSTVERFDYAPCLDGQMLQLLRVSGGGHMWPGTSVILSGLGNINQDIDASAEIWNFFSTHSCASSAAETLSTPGVLSCLSPFQDYILLQGLSTPQAAYRLLDVQGHLIQEGTTSGRVDTHSLSDGLYLLSVENHVFKVLKQGR